MPETNSRNQFAKPFRIVGNITLSNKHCEGRRSGEISFHGHSHSIAGTYAWVQRIAISRILSSAYKQ